MQVYRIEITPRQKHSAARYVNAAHQLGIAHLTACYPTRLFFLEGEITPAEAENIAARLLADPVTETYTIATPSPNRLPVPEEGESHASSDINSLPPRAGEGQGMGVNSHTIEITFHPGVTDPIAENLTRAAHLIGVPNLRRSATGQSHTLEGDLSTDDLNRLATEVLANPIIQRHLIDAAINAPFVAFQDADDTVESIALKDADDAQLKVISHERRLSLDLNEMRAIRDYYAEINREPTDAELEMLAQTWSEHCVHKTFKAQITYSGPAHGASPDSPPVEQKIDGLLKTYLRTVTDKLNKPWVYSAFVDNAGIIRFDDQWDIAFKVETHNRPSALEPFGGANTGVGGVIRDVLGVGARPIANTDILCFGPPDLSPDALPEGVLHPRRIADGVVAGVEDYGNKMGIPTVNGAIVYHPGYTSNPLVFCGCLGILPHGSHISSTQPGDLIVVVGGRTGRDGLRGATFSSMEMDTSTATLSGGAVQIGHPIMEKQVQEVILRARDEKLYTAITDCGAGGLSSAVGEMGAEIGARVQLADVSLKYPGLRPWEIWLSEAQERMVLAVSPQHWPRLQQIAIGQDVEAVVIGTFEPTGHLYLYYGEKLVGDLSMHFLHDGIPQRNMVAEWVSPHPPTPSPSWRGGENLSETLLRLLAMPTIRSKEDVIRRYDHEVQTGTAVKPLVGVESSGPGDATVLVPLDTLALTPQSPLPHGEGTPLKALALSNGVCPTYGEIDPYAMAWAAVDEAMRNLIAVGADPDQVAILDNFSWGNTQLPDRLGSLVRCAQGCHDAALAYGTPFISGKDSLNNEYLGEDGQRHAIPGTLVISAVGIVPDVNKTVTMDFKQPGNLLYTIGVTRDELGGSHYNLLHAIDGGTVPQPNPNALNVMRALHQAIQAGIVQSCHDVSEGGLAVALAEMCIAGGHGCDVDLSGIAVADPTGQLFSETASRWIVEVPKGQDAAFQSYFAGELADLCGFVGQVTPLAVLNLRDADQPLINVPISDLERAWRGTVLDADAVGTRHDSSAAASDGLKINPITKTRPVRTITGRLHLPKVLILHANGSNRDRDAFLACELAGGLPEIVHVNQIMSGERKLLDYHMLVIPGGFSYGDDLGAGVLWALDLRERLTGIDQFVEHGRPVLGICNGFQTLVKAGLIGAGLPLTQTETFPVGTRHASSAASRPITLTHNERARFECRWVYLQPNLLSACLFTENLTDLIYCPVAHGEGRVMVTDDSVLEQVIGHNMHALTYVDANGESAVYPLNPNGSVMSIAGLCNAEGNVFGLMPHPENHIFPWQHPHRTRGANGMSGLALFKNGLKHS